MGYVVPSVTVKVQGVDMQELLDLVGDENKADAIEVIRAMGFKVEE